MLGLISSSGVDGHDFSRICGMQRHIFSCDGAVVLFIGEDQQKNIIVVIIMYRGCRLEISSCLAFHEAANKEHLRCLTHQIFSINIAT